MLDLLRCSNLWQQCPETLLNVLSNLRRLGTAKNWRVRRNGGRECLWHAAFCFSRCRSTRYQITLYPVACEEDEKPTLSWLPPHWGSARGRGCVSPALSAAISPAPLHHSSGSNPPGSAIRQGKKFTLQKAVSFCNMQKLVCCSPVGQTDGFVSWTFLLLQ